MRKLSFDNQADLDLDLLPSSLARVSKAGVIEQANEAFCTLFGYETGELNGKPVTLLVGANMRDKHPQMMEALNRNPVKREMAKARAMSCPTKQGTLKYVQLALSPVYGKATHGKPSELVGWYVAATDTQQQLGLSQANEDLLRQVVERKHHMLEHFKQREGLLQALCHDIRAPLAMASAAMRDTADDASVQEELRDKLIGAHSKLFSSVQKLIDFSETKAGEFALRKQIRVVDSLFTEVVLEVRQEFNLPATRLSYTSRLPKGLRARSDWQLVKSVLYEMLAEAVHYRHASDLKLSAQINETRDGAKLEINLTDNGDKHVDLTADGIAKYRVGGNELSKELLHTYTSMIGGTTKFSTVLGGRQRCQFVVPIDEVSEARLHVDDAVPEKGEFSLAGLNVLLVEDDRLVRTINTLMLNKAKVNVTAAENGAMGLEILQASRQKFDLVITDLHMPKMDGFEFALAVRSFRKYQHLKIVALTAGGSERDRSMALSAGVDGLLLKPLKVEEVQNWYTSEMQRLNRPKCVEA